MSLQLVGITDDATARRIELNRAEADLKGVILIEACGLAAIAVRPSRTGWLRNRSKNKLIEKLSTEQRRLEALIKLGPLLPAAGDARFDSAADISAFLVASANGLRSELDAYGSLVQFQVFIAWDAERFRARIALSPEPVMPPGADGDDQAVSTERMKKDLAVKAEGLIAVRSRACLSMPLGSDHVVANLVVLIAKSEEPLLDEALATIDAIAPDALSIRVTGPLPPLSFACVAVDMPSEPSIRAARRLLGINAEASTEAVRLAYLQNAKAVHPDSAGALATSAGAADLTEIKTAYDLLMRIHAMRSKDGKAPALASIRREGDLARAI
jgi:hypothetical protein